MNIVSTQLTYYLNQTKHILDYLSLESIDNEINKYVYPIGIIMFSSLEPRTEITNENLLTYLQNNFKEIFVHHYSDEEINIISYYIYLFYLRTSNFSNELVKILTALLTYNTEKAEIQYCLDEIKYRLLLYYITYTDNTEIIMQYSNDLQVIEEEHNKMILGAKK